MADVIIEVLVPYLADIAEVAIFVSVVGMVISLLKNAFTKGEIRF